MGNYNNATGAGPTAVGTAAAASVKVPPLPPAVLPLVGVSPDLTAEHLAVLGAWYCLYCPGKEAQQVAALAQHFSDNTNFEDNFIKVCGHEQLGALMYGLQHATKGITLAIEKVEVLKHNGSSSSGSKSSTYQLRITGKHCFYLPAVIRGPVTSLVLPAALEPWATGTLTVRAADNIVTHWQQRVHHVPTVPWLLCASLGGCIALVLTHMLGW